MSSIVRWKPVVHRLPIQNPRSRITVFLPRKPRFSRGIFSRRSSKTLSTSNPRHILPIVRSNLAQAPPPLAGESEAVTFSQSFPLKRTQSVEGKISVRLAKAKEGGSKWKLIVGCNLEGEWILHWGVTYCDDFSSEWDQPPPEMRPPGSIPVKDYAIETPLKKSPSALEGKILHEVQIEFDISSTIASIHFVLKEERTGAWFQHRGRDFRIPLTNFPGEDKDRVGEKQHISVWPGALDQISSLLLNPKNGSHSKLEDAKGTMQHNSQIAEFYEEYPICIEHFVQNSMTVVVKRSNETDKNLVQIDTDIPGDVVIHWGVCRDNNNKQWEVPSAPHPPSTKKFRKRALRTLLQQKADGLGSWGVFPVDKEFSGVLFVLKLSEYAWLNNLGTDFYIPLESMIALEKSDIRLPGKSLEAKNQVDNAAYTDEIISDIRNLATDISSERGKSTKNIEARENILQEIEKLAAEAYSIFRSSIPTFVEESVPDAQQLKTAVKISSGTGSGYEILCQGFNWESHKSGRWYSELSSKANELSSLGFTTVWLPPPTVSVSPEGYMPTDLYNLNSRYGSMEELKTLVKRFHEVGIKVLGDAVLNHRCAQYKNRNGIWNIFGGRLNWDERAVVADDPHFQGRGNKSSGDNFHAAPNIDHSQDFVRDDLKEWLCWLRNEVGYDGWRLDFVRGFWGGYVKDYMEASEPYFAVGEFWDSLSYKYGEMEHNQDAHRQRITDWINATNGTAGAFDVTTKGILHTALEKCEYWRLSDEKGKPPGVVGWWPSRAVTFIENHDTGSTQGHWRFPSGKELQGYAYILTHPGTPAVFYDHIFSHYQQEISKLIALRKRAKINCRSLVKITKAVRDVYAAEVDEKVQVKIGPGYYEPSSNGPKKWNLTLEGKDYKIWESS